MQNLWSPVGKRKKDKSEQREDPLWVRSTFMRYSTKALFILVPMRMKMALVDWDVIVFLFFRGGESLAEEAIFASQNQNAKQHRFPCLSTFMPSTCGIFHSITPQHLLPSRFGGISSQRWRAAERFKHRPVEISRHLIGMWKQTRTHFYNFCNYFQVIFCFKVSNADKEHGIASTPINLEIELHSSGVEERDRVGQNKTKHPSRNVRRCVRCANSKTECFSAESSVCFAIQQTCMQGVQLHEKLSSVQAQRGASSVVFSTWNECLMSTYFCRPINSAHPPSSLDLHDFDCTRSPFLPTVAGWRKEQAVNGLHHPPWLRISC